METLVAIFILLLSITGPMVFAQNGLRAAFVSRDQITAFYLAQDAMEYIKNIRDNRWVEHGPEANMWLSDIDSSCFLPSGCSVDTTIDNDTTAFLPCSNINNAGCIGDSSYTPLKYDSTDNTFGHRDGGDSMFARKIYINELTPDDKEAEVTVTIKWNSHEVIGEREIVVRENIFNWLLSN